MKFALVLSCIVVAVVALDEREATINFNNLDINPDGSFKASYETSNGIYGESTGTLYEVAPGESALGISGANSYFAPNGEKVELSYTADADGYHPVGKHLPTSPPPMEIPEYVLKALAYIEKIRATQA